MMPHPFLIISQSDYLIQIFYINSNTEWQTVDPDQLASEEANWSGSTLFAKAGYIQVQQDKGLGLFYNSKFHFNDNLFGNRCCGWNEGSLYGQ